MLDYSPIAGSRLHMNRLTGCSRKLVVYAIASFTR